MLYRVCEGKKQNMYVIRVITEWVMFLELAEFESLVLLVNLQLNYINSRINFSWPMLDALL